MEGRTREARDLFRRAIAEFSNPGDLPLAARAALWGRDVAAAREDLTMLDAAGIHGPTAEADRTTMRAGIAALEARPAEALALYREALRAWRELGLAWDEALCGMDMALLLDPSEPEVRAVAESTREILTRLGARPFLARLETALAKGAPEQPRATTSATPDTTVSSVQA